MVRVAETIDEAMETAALELVRESLSISMAGEGPWWQPAGRKLGSVPYHLWTWSDLDLCRLESQRMMTHNEFGIGGTTKRVDYVVDQGFKYSIVESKGEVVQKADIDQLNEFLELITSANSFADLEAETVLRMDRDGEVFLRLFWNDDGIVDVRFVEPARVRPGPGADTKLASPERWGIDVEPHDAKRITGYWVEPDIGLPPKLIPEDEIVHIIHNNGGAIPRGIPVYQPVFENLRRCEDLLTGMSSIAKARAKIALIRKIAGLNAVKAENIKSRLTSGTQQNPDGTIRNVSIDEYPFGSVLRVNADESFEFPSSNVGAADLIQVLQADLRSIASLLSMPEWMFTGLADQKYSNAFVVEAPTLKAFRRLQGKLVKGLATGRYKSQASVLWRCLRMAAERDVISKDVLTKCKIKCVPPSLEARDKQSESSVNKTYLDAGVIDKQTVQESIGLDPVETNRRIAAEKATAPPTPPVVPGAKPLSAPSPDLKPKLTKVGESWYTRRALEWITEGRDRSHLVKTKITDKNGISRTVYKRPAKSANSKTDTQKPDATGKADSPSPAKPQSRTDTEAKSLVDYFKNGGEAQGDTPQDRMHFVFGKLKSLFKSSTPKPEPLKILDYQKPQVDRVAAMINKSEGLTEEHKKEYTAATEEVLSRMPKAAHWRILRNLDNAEFSPDPKSMTLKFLNRIMDDPEKEGISISKIMTYATWQTRIEKQGLDEFAYGIYSTKNKRLDLDGGGLVKDGPFGTPNGAKVKDVYAHEFGHVLDGPYHEISGSGEFRNAYFEEILGGVGRAGSDLMQDPYPEGAPVPLTEYAKTSPEEGFGEFCRLVYSGSHDLAKVQAAFPKCSNVLVMRGLWPEQVNAK